MSMMVLSSVSIWEDRKVKAKDITGHSTEGFQAQQFSFWLHIPRVILHPFRRML
jgi:hypothetical protein